MSSETENTCSTIDADPFEFGFIFVKKQLSKLNVGKFVYSPPCVVHNLPWKIMIERYEEAFFAFKLVCDVTSTREWSCNVTGEFTVHSHLKDRVNRTTKFKNVFCRERKIFMLELVNIYDQERGIYLTDSVKVEVHITISSSSTSYIVADLKEVPQSLKEFSDVTSTVNEENQKFIQNAMKNLKDELNEKLEATAKSLLHEISTLKMILEQKCSNSTIPTVRTLDEIKSHHGEVEIEDSSTDDSSSDGWIEEKNERGEVWRFDSGSEDSWVKPFCDDFVGEVVEGEDDEDEDDEGEDDEGEDDADEDDECEYNETEKDETDEEEGNNSEDRVETTVETEEIDATVNDKKVETRTEDTKSETPDEDKNVNNRDSTVTEDKKIDTRVEEKEVETPVEDKNINNGDAVTADEKAETRVEEKEGETSVEDRKVDNSNADPTLLLILNILNEIRNEKKQISPPLPPNSQPPMSPRSRSSCVHVSKPQCHYRDDFPRASPNCYNYNEKPPSFNSCEAGLKSPYDPFGHSHLKTWLNDSSESNKSSTCGCGRKSYEY